MYHLLSTLYLHGLHLHQFLHEVVCFKELSNFRIARDMRMTDVRGLDRSGESTRRLKYKKNQMTIKAQQIPNWNTILA